EWQPVTKNVTLDCSTTADTILEPGQETTIQYTSWAHSIFGETGIYKISATIDVPDDATKNSVIESNEFEIKPEGFLGTLWTGGFYQPIYNVLIFLISIMPGHDLGLAIILLTIIIRTILLIPSHKALKSQRKLQELQPRLNHLKEKHKDNQEALAKETMLLWKEHKVNPFGSCLPLVIQLPVLIALFYVIQSGLNPDNAYLLYGGLQGFSLSNINVNFLGILDLTKINSIILPLLVGGLQFVQMKLAMMRTEKKKKDAPADKEKKKSEMEMANQMMIYFMPIMIALFTASVPSGVGLYWCVSTLYGIAQQFVVNRQVSGEKGENPEGVKVRVVQ
ncbi:MAG TPA: YidC/Oxa1 family membrane protein insertase, partial [Candidatus Gracilibacteria bacterium]|nr:YidC/Oxa1 family membrane protein insertase [Candidatus Gracilibacteria bacterium]